MYRDREQQEERPVLQPLLPKAVHLFYGRCWKWVLLSPPSASRSPSPITCFRQQQPGQHSDWRDSGASGQGQAAPSFQVDPKGHKGGPCCPPCSCLPAPHPPTGNILWRTLLPTDQGRLKTGALKSDRLSLTSPTPLLKLHNPCFGFCPPAPASVCAALHSTKAHSSLVLISPHSSQPSPHQQSGGRCSVAVLEAV